MTHGELLQTLAELSITLVGFTGIVAVLGRRGEGEWSRIERAQLESLLSAGFCGVVFALAPLVVASAELEEPTIWRAGNAVAGVAHLVGASWYWIRIGPRRVLGRALQRFTTAAVPIPAALILAQRAAGVGFLAALGPFFYLATLLWWLIVGVVQFIFLLIRTRAA